jgi:hypothetical protein
MWSRRGHPYLLPCKRWDFVAPPLTSNMVDLILFGGAVERAALLKALV